VSKAYGLLEGEGLLTHRPGLPLVVSPRPPGVERREREAQLAGLLEPVAMATRQLGIEPDEALELFGRLLSDTDNRGEKER